MFSPIRPIRPHPATIPPDLPRPSHNQADAWLYHAHNTRHAHRTRSTGRDTAGIVDTRTPGRTRQHARTRPRAQPHATPENPCHTPALPPAGSPYDTSCEERRNFWMDWVGCERRVPGICRVSFGAGFGAKFWSMDFAWCLTLRGKIYIYISPVCNRQSTLATAENYT